MVQKKDETGSQVVLNEHRFRHVDQEARWRQEYSRTQTIERKLTEVSNLLYEPIDYSHALERIPWKDPVFTDYTYLLQEAQQRVEKEYFTKMLTWTVGALLLVAVLIVMANELVLWLAGAVAAGFFGAIYLLWTNKQSDLAAAKREAQQEIDKKEYAERRANEVAKQEHERKEDERIIETERLIQGDIPAVMLKLDTIMPKLPIPFALELDIEIGMQVLYIRAWLPTRSIIPAQTCEMQANGRLKYTDKTLLDVNKQYLELCAATLLQVMSLAYMHIPALDKGYIVGMMSEDLQNKCLMQLSLDRSKLAAACQAANGITALAHLSARFEYDSNLKLNPIEVVKPEEWKGLEQKHIQGMHIKIIR